MKDKNVFDFEMGEWVKFKLYTKPESYGIGKIVSSEIRFQYTISLLNSTSLCVRPYSEIYKCSKEEAMIHLMENPYDR